MRALWLCTFIVSSAIAMEYEGEARKFIENDVFTCPSTGVKIKTPDLGSSKLKIHYKETNPGISWQLYYVEEMGHVATVKYTKIRKEYPKTDDFLMRTASNIKGNTIQEGGYVEWCAFLSKEEGKVFECIIRYPGVGQTVSIRNDWLGAMESVQMDVYGLRRYLVRDGFFVEFEYYIPQFLPTGSYNEDKYLNPWLPKLTDLMVNSSFVQKKEELRKQIENAERPDTFFRFVFKDPSHG